MYFLQTKKLEKSLSVYVSFRKHSFMKIHPTAIVHPHAKIHENAVIGPYCIIEEDVEIGEDTILHSSVVVHSGTRIGIANQIYHGAFIGGLPQDLSFDPRKKTFTIIGNKNTIREGAIIHRATKQEGGTRIGNENYLMGNSHIAHDVCLGNKVILVQNSVIGGHAVVEDGAFISGLVAIHQFCRIGQNSIIGGCSKVVKDVPPFVTIDGNPAEVAGLNSVGLKRSGFSLEVRNAIKRAYKVLYHSGLNTRQALERLKEENSPVPEVQKIIHFFEASKRGVSDHRKIGLKGSDDPEE